ncbi:hypothetical protein B0H17DRAFT_1325257 [Mycena rosella]|uniref:DUF6533 domain-containing protein n=1 Tax=Mycena rosella TaxID=1033263 RepID=A0AAD7M9U7_MYCRO|nr:hypothetical protein B0H17DRAFT_1325257 [Mycena rosella]
MSTPSELEAELFQLIADTQTTNYLVAAALTLAAFELIANFNDELELVWKGPLRVSNAIYIWMRYCTIVIVGQVSLLSNCAIDSLDTVRITSNFRLREVKSDHSCRSFLLAEAIACSFILVTADLILVLRVWILYGRQKKLLYFLLSLITVELIAMIITAAFAILPLRGYFHIGRTILGCYSLEVPRYLAFYAAPTAVMTFIMFGMTLYKCGRTLLDNRAVRMPIITLFLRDGVFWFLAIFAISLADLLVWAHGRAGLAQTMIA